MNILILDDNVEDTKKIKNDLWNFFCNYEDKVHFDIFSKINQNIPFLKYQLAFLDIDLEDEKYTGIDIAQRIKEFNSSCYIVFISAKNNLIHSTLKVQPFFFIRKSNYIEDLDVFFMIFKDRIRHYDVVQIEYLSEQHVINIEDIIYIKATNHKSTLYTKRGTFQDNRTLKLFLKILPHEKYVQIHRAIIINFDYLLKRTNSAVILSMNTDCPIELQIGRTYKENFNKAYREMLLR